MLLLAVALGLTPLAAAAQAEAPRKEEPMGLQVALSGGIGAGAGYIYKNGVSTTTGQLEDLKIIEASSVSIFVLLEVGYRATPHWYLGLWGSYEYVFAKTNAKSCPEGFDCDFRQWRFGIEGRYHFLPGKGFDPWVGLGTGVEITPSDVEGEVPVPIPGVGTVPAQVKTSVTDRGVTYARLTLGGDVRLTRMLYIGPIITASIGSYTVRTGEQTVTIPNVATRTTPVSPADNGFHGLFTLALRLAWLPM